MITRNFVRRLERLEAYLAPPSDEPALVIHMTCVGQEDRIIEVRGLSKFAATTLPAAGDDPGHRGERSRDGDESAQQGGRTSGSASGLPARLI
jgi:hypothetical protein